jgi:hypothetical protein
MRSLAIALGCALLLAPSAFGADAKKERSISKLPPAQGRVPLESSQKELVEQFMAVSGLKEMLSRLPDQLVAGVTQGFGSGGDQNPSAKGIAAIAGNAYPKGSFVAGVTNALEKHYDEKRYVRQLERVSTPLARRMADLENQPPDPAAYQRFMTETASRPLSPDRIQLIKKMDTLSGASALNLSVTLNHLDTFAAASIGDCPDKLAETRKALAKQRPEIEKATRNSVQVMLAYTYRDVSDADLREYLKVYENSDGTWMQRIIRTAIEEQFKAGAAKMAEALKTIMGPQHRNKSMFTPECE